jgi:putative membrane protein
MKKTVTAGAVLALLVMCALLAAVTSARSGGQNTNSNSNTKNMNSNSNTSGGNSNMSQGSMKMTSDQKFAMEAAMGGMEEVEMGRVAAQKGASDEVRQFGQRMVDDHSKANQDLMQVASGKGMTLPTGMGSKQQADMQKLSGLSGDKFDKEYVKMMVKDHKKDVAEFQKESTGGMDADIKGFASRTLPTLQEHLQMIQRINDKMMMRKSNGNTNSNSSSNRNSNM